MAATSGLGQWFLDSAPAPSSAGGSPSFRRLFRAFLSARAALGLALLSAQLLSAAFWTPPTGISFALSVCYALASVLFWAWPGGHQEVSSPSFATIRSATWWSTIGVDLALFGVLHALDAGGVNYGALFVMPVLMGAVLSPRRLALATAAIAALCLLGAGGWALALGADGGVRMTQAGLLGGGLFAVSLLASELSARLAREEQAARGSLALARQQELLNRLVIDEMEEGVLVVDRLGRVRAMNPAARMLLGADDGEPSWQLRGRADWQPLAAALDEAHVRGGAGDERDVTLMLNGQVLRSLRLRLRFTRQREGSEELCVLFLEDNRELLARTRQEKLAAMGRVSAGIAHEIRNPLAAIAQANALIAEDVAGMRAEELTRMVASNVQRLKRLVDDVTEVAPGVRPDTQALDVSSIVHESCDEWARVNRVWVGGEGRFHPVIEPGLWGLFDAEHLRRVLVNLLDNAHRHADPVPGAIQLSLTREQDELVLSVRSAGAPVAPEVERYLFEPFFSTRSRGSGLGLYICRELCERHGAQIDFRRLDEAAANEFRVRLRAATD